MSTLDKQNPSPSGEGAPSASPPTGRGWGWVSGWLPLFIILAVALVARAAYWLLVMPAADRGLVVDEPEYFAGAVVFASGRGFSFWDTFLWTRTPLYPATLGFTFQLFGHDDLLPVHLLQLALNLASIAVLYLLTRRTFGPTVAFVTGLLAAIYLPFIILPYLLLGETLFILLFGLFLLAITGVSQRIRFNGETEETNKRIGPIPLCILAGIFLGLATLVRGTALVYLPFAALVLWLNLRRQTASQRIRFNRETEKTDAAAPWINSKPGASATRPYRNSNLIAVFLLAAIITVAPWTVRNYAAYGYFIPTDTTAGYNFWLGANGVRDGSRLAADLLAIPNQGARQDYAYARGFELFRADPLAYLGKGLKEMNDLWAGNFTAEERFTRGYTHGLVPAAHLVASILLDDTLYLILVPLAIIGLFAAPRHPLRGYVAAWALTNFALAFIFFAVTRFRLAVLFFLLPYAAWALCNLPTLWRSMYRNATGRDKSRPYSGTDHNVGAQFIARWRQPYRVAFASVLIVAFLVVNLPSYPLAETVQGVSTWGRQQHLTAGDTLLAAGDLAGAAREYNQGDQSLAETQTAQADLSLRQGNLAAAQQLATTIPADYWGRYLIFGAIARIQHADPTPAFADRTVRESYAEASAWAWNYLPPQPSCDLQVGDEGQSMSNVLGFGLSEIDGGQQYRWTMQPIVSLRLCPLTVIPMPSQGGSRVTLTLLLRAYRPTPLAEPNITVSIAGTNIATIAATADWQTYTVTVPLTVVANVSGATLVQLSSSTFVPAGSDPRLLGFMLAEAKLEGK
jgi:dolichyl-phosphate-mannose-protein mannosyltransferase